MYSYESTQRYFFPYSVKAKHNLWLIWFIYHFGEVSVVWLLLRQSKSMKDPTRHQVHLHIHCTSSPVKQVAFMVSKKAKPVYSNAKYCLDGTGRRFSFLLIDLIPKPMIMITREEGSYWHEWNEGFFKVKSEVFCWLRLNPNPGINCEGREGGWICCGNN